jgi:zinc protease
MISAFQGIPEVDFERVTLANGLTVLLHESRLTPVVALVVMYHVGSKNERPGRTGLAHLFEHVMFKGSAHVPDGDHFRLLQEIGASINGSTTEDRTNYFEVVPRNALELALYLESDRMGYLLPALSQEKLDNQRDVVKNERRQSYDNQPYGLAGETLSAALFPEDHPYHWPIIGSMADLSAASLDDVKGFFRTHYVPSNACIALSGDFDRSPALEMVSRYFEPIRGVTVPPQPAVLPPALEDERRITLEDRVHLPRLYLAWLSAPLHTRDDALLDILTNILSAGKSSRLHRRLVYEKQIAQSVNAYQDGGEIAGAVFIDATARPGHSLTELESQLTEELDRILQGGVTEEELQGAIHQVETRMVYRRSTNLGKANSLATFHTLTGDAANFNREPERFAGINIDELTEVARRFITPQRVVLSIVPQGQGARAARGGQ